MEKLTHWKKLINNQYLNEGDLDGISSIIATIKSIGRKDVTNPKGKTEELVVLEFYECKPMILSAKKNYQNIESALKTPHIEKWIGQKIEIYYDPNVKFGSEKVGGVRIKPIAPRVDKPALTTDHPKWDEICMKIRDGNSTVEVVERFFSLSPEVKELLTNIKPNNNA